MRHTGRQLPCVPGVALAPESETGSPGHRLAADLDRGALLNEPGRIRRRSHYDRYGRRPGSQPDDQGTCRAEGNK
ncbi:hypothetical protein GCM10017772_14160 [Promicromonospora soli]|uniref:Uncharacterized protein n=1 Tax=Promicromonospora soli TaxID=2035533 RepID=A0A919FPM4_9MICO|nr:hypothetical protein GCM10017772_14160 [Promicromonospora soli]